MKILEVLKERQKKVGFVLGTVCLVSLCDWEMAGHLLFKVVRSNSPVASDCLLEAPTLGVLAAAGHRIMEWLELAGTLEIV